MGNIYTETVSMNFEIPSEKNLISKYVKPWSYKSPEDCGKLSIIAENGENALSN